MIVGQAHYAKWTTFMVRDDGVDQVVPWCRENFGKTFYGFMDSTFGWRLSNWGRWTFEYRPENLLGASTYVKVFLRKPEDIMLFLVRWS